MRPYAPTWRQETGEGEVEQIRLFFCAMFSSSSHMMDNVSFAGPIKKCSLYCIISHCDNLTCKSLLVNITPADADKFSSSV